MYSSFVFRPGGATFDNVFADWGDLIAQVNATPGFRLILIDGSHVAGDVHIPAGTWPLNDCVLTSSAEGNGLDDIITFDDGAVIVSHGLWLVNVYLHSDSSSPVVTFSGGKGGVIVGIFSEIECGAGKAPFFHVAADAGFCTFIGLHELSLGDSTTPVLLADGGLELQLSNHSILFPHALTGAGEIDIEIDPDTQYQEPQDATNIHKYLQATAPLLQYVPAVPADWSGTGVMTVQAALDRIAAKIGPIP